MAKATLADLREAAQREIDKESTLAYVVADDYGQIFANVKPMTWFRDRVAEYLIDTRKKYMHLSLEESGDAGST